MDWFYSEKNTSNLNNQLMDERKQKAINKIEKEMNEWKQLLDFREIDEVTYKQEIDRLKQKQTKILMNK